MGIIILKVGFLNENVKTARNVKNLIGNNNNYF